MFKNFFEWVKGRASYKSRERIEGIISGLERRGFNGLKDLPLIEKRIVILEKSYSNKLRIVKIAEDPRFKSKTPIGPTKESLLSVIETQQTSIKIMESSYAEINSEIRGFKDLNYEFLAAIGGKNDGAILNIPGMPKLMQEMAREQEIQKRLDTATSDMLGRVRGYGTELEKQKGLVENAKSGIGLTTDELNRPAGEEWALRQIKNNYHKIQESIISEFKTTKRMLSELKEAKMIYDEYLVKVANAAEVLDAFLTSNNEDFVYFRFRNCIRNQVMYRETYYLSSEIDINSDDYIKNRIRQIREKDPKAKTSFLSRYSTFIGEFEIHLFGFSKASGNLLGLTHHKILILVPFVRKRLEMVEHTTQEISKLKGKCTEQLKRLEDDLTI